MKVKQALMDLKLNVLFLLKWVCIATVLGGICGFVGSMFHISVDYVTEFRHMNDWIIYLLPIGGIVIVFLYHSVNLHNEPGTNTIIQSVRQQDSVPMLLAPAIFFATVITHLFGGSSGREGAALQIGGSVATTIGKIIHADKKEMSILIMCGMSGVFSALFGTPLTATLFSMEVVSVGVFYYAAFVPCLCSSLISLLVAQFFGCSAVSYPISHLIIINPMNILKLLGFIVCIALFSIIFILMMHYSHKFFHDNFENPYIRVCVGSGLLILLVLFVGKKYLGAGMEVVEQAIYTQVLPYDFIMKALFTAITIGCGFKGGEIVPTFFIGATLGYALGIIFQFDPHIGAALGIVGMFCCVVNSPLTSIILGVEIFGGTNIVAFAIVVAFCYVLSGYFSLYQAQKIVYSKTSPEFINRNGQ